MPETHEFRDAAILTRALQCLLVALIIIEAVSFISNIAQQSLLQSRFTQAEGAANDSRQYLIAIIGLVALATTIIVFACWIYRAAANAQTFGAASMTVTAGWAVGSYFIPIGNLWLPFKAMREIWKISKDPKNWQNLATDPILGWWWLGWITSGILGQVSFRMLISAHDIDSLSAATTVSMMNELVDVVAIVLALVLVTQLYGMQRMTHYQQIQPIAQTA